MDYENSNEFIVAIISWL